MVSVNFQNYEKVYQTSGAKKINQTAPFPSATNEESKKTPAFKSGAYTTSINIRTQLTTSDEKKKYKELSQELDLKYRKKLEYALKSGVLLKNNSDDKSTVLDNLHKIFKEERDLG